MRAIGYIVIYFFEGCSGSASARCNLDQSVSTSLESVSQSDNMNKAASVVLSEKLCLKSEVWINYCLIYVWLTALVPTSSARSRG